MGDVTVTHAYCKIYGEDQIKAKISQIELAKLIIIVIYFHSFTKMRSIGGGCGSAEDHASFQWVMLRYILEMSLVHHRSDNYGQMTIHYRLQPCLTKNT